MDVEAFLLSDYNLKVRYLSDHFSRMWTRFNFFLSIESALLALSFHQELSKHVQFIAVTGTLLGFAWYYFGMTDNYLVDVYRKQAGQSYYLLRRILEGDLEKHSSKSELAVFSYAGDVNEQYFGSEPDKILRIAKNPLQWRYKNFSVTELAVLFPVAFIVIWIARIIVFKM
jgi:hypothetical protein